MEKKLLKELYKAASEGTECMSFSRSGEVLEVFGNELEEFINNKNLPVKDSTNFFKFLNLSGFKKVGTYRNKLCYKNENFQRGYPELLKNIKQKTRTEDSTATNQKEVGSSDIGGIINLETARTNARSTNTILPNVAKKLKLTNQKEVETTPDLPLRPLVIDGCNVGYTNEKGCRNLSIKKINTVVNYFLQLGHNEIKVFLPLPKKDQLIGIKSPDVKLLRELEKRNHMVYTPWRRIGNVDIIPYDDMFIVEYATIMGAVIISNDNYRDLRNKKPEFRHTIEKRVLMFLFIDDLVLFPWDPLGKHEIHLEECLRFSSLEEHNEVKKNIWARINNSRNVIEVDSSVEEFLSAPRITEPLKNQVLKESSPLRLECNYIGDSDVTWTCMKPILSSQNIKQVADGKKAVLEITNCSAEDAGIYQCSVKNYLGTASTKAAVTLKGKTAPIIINELQDLTVKEKSAIMLICDIFADPAANIQWKLNGTELQCDNIKYFLNIVDDTIMLIIRKCDLIDSGVYTCEANNIFGKAVTTATVKVKI